MIKKNVPSNIQFHFLVKSFSLQKRNHLKIFICSLFKNERKIFDSVNYIFCSDPYLLHINKIFLQHDYYTDIITFNLAEQHEHIVGEIYISIDRVKDNARVLNEPFKRELLRVIFHGALHLCGFLDKRKKEVLLMREKESFYLNQYLDK